MKFRHCVLSCASVVALASSEAAFAQNSGSGIEEVVVTARKRVEDLQQVPLSVTAFSIESLRQRNIGNVYDLAQFTPNYKEIPQLGRRLDRPTIRGQAGTNVFGEANASYFIDGVFVSGSLSTSTFDALQRVEIIRGPQSAIFGRATFAGAINLITRKPNNEFEGQINARVASHDDYKTSGWFSGPIVADKLLFFVSANWEQYGGEWRNGLLENEATNTRLGPPPFAPFAFVNPPQRGDNTKLGGEESTDVTGRLVFRPAENHEFNFKYSFTGGKDDHFPAFALTRAELNCCRPGIDAGAPAATARGYFCGEIEADGRVSKINIPDFVDGVTTLLAGRAAPAPFVGTRRHTYRALGEYTGDFSEWNLLLRGSWSRDYFRSARDLDRSPARAVFGLFHSFEEFRTEDYSFEGRVQSPEDNALRVQAGAFYFHSNNKAHDRRFTGPSATGVAFDPNGRDKSGARAKNYAVFGQLEYDVSPQVEVSLEARYADDEKIAFAPTQFRLPNGTLSNEISATTKTFLPRFIVNYKPSDDLTVYGLVAKGDKPLDFNSPYFDQRTLATETAAALADGRAIISEEIAWTYEAGVKSRLLDQRARLNTSVFYIDWKNQALNGNGIVLQAGTSGPPFFTPTIVPTTFNLVVTAPKARVYGIEIEGDLAVSDNILLNVGYGMADHEFKKFNDREWLELTGQNDPTLANGGNLKGHTNGGTPKHSLSLGASYRDALSAEADWFIRSTLNYETKRWASVFNLAHTGDRYLWGAQLGVETETWNVTLYADNILDDDTPRNVGRFTDFFAATWPNGTNAYQLTPNPQRGRAFGLKAQYSF